MKTGIFNASTLAVLAIATLGFTQQAQSQCSQCTTARDACLKDCTKTVIQCDDAFSACIDENVDKGCAGGRVTSTGEAVKCEPK
jgi:hypothetical protein